MTKNLAFAQNHHLRTTLVLAGLWLASWALLALMPEDLQPLGVPLITWAHVFLGLLAVVVSFGSVYLFKQRDNAP